MSARTVLIVDDEDPIRDAVRFILKDAGFVVLEAPNGLVGLDLLRASDGPLIVLLDLMMPGMSGIELLHVISGEPALASRDAYIIFTAARAFSAPTVRFFLPGKRLFDLPKPFNLDDLVAIVERAALQLDSDAADSETEISAPVEASGTEGEAGGT